MNQLDGVPPLGKRRPRTTRRRVFVADVLARRAITAGGIGTILSVLAVCAFLLWEVVDLFRPAAVGEPVRTALANPEGAGDSVPLAEAGRLVGCDEYRTVAWILDTSAARLSAFAVADGRRVGSWPVREDGVRLACAGRDVDGKSLVLGWADGTVTTARVEFETRYLEPTGADTPDALRSLAAGETGVHEDAVYELTEGGQLRGQALRWSVGEALAMSGAGAITAVARGATPDGVVIAAADARGAVHLARGERSLDPFTGESEMEWSEPVTASATPPSPPKSGEGLPPFLAITDLGSNLLMVDRSGELVRLSIRDLDDVREAERLDVFAASPGAPPAETAAGSREVTAASLLLGGSTLILGDSRGGIQAWFVHPDPAQKVDRTRLGRAHRFELASSAPVRRLASAPRQRVFAASDAVGDVEFFYMTSEKLLGRVHAGAPLEALAFSPRVDALLVASDANLTLWPFDARHPEVSWRSLFGRIWYERHEQPAFVWQSSSASDDFEPKMSLVPLIFGTLKATFYSLLFGVPLALLAAIYTSEFLDRRWRARIKPVVELMASLPSVVLGFFAAIVLAPLVEAAIPELIAALFTVPFTLLLGAHLWQLGRLGQGALRERLRIPLVLLSLLVGVAAAAQLGSAVRDGLFAGDVVLWLDGQRGTGFAAWLLMLLPLAAAGVGFATVRLSARLRTWSRALTRRGAGLYHLAKFLAASAAALSLAALAASFSAELWDPRSGSSLGGLEFSPFGTYEQRNALVVGFVMGFAIIPIIYTMAEDALSSVPASLRAASLGAGATQWQTAVRIVVPTAMSGLFSACMIGLGRAVGETMIVLMAAGNTPILDMNIFNGFRSLAANIATELSEAVPGSTHYRTLFLAALVLFAMTFVVNGIAESIRIRFRRRALEL